MAQSFLPPHPHLDKLTKEFESQPKLSLGQMYDAFCAPVQKDNKQGMTDAPVLPENGFLHVSQTEDNTDVFRNGQHNMPAGKRQKLEELIAKIPGNTAQPRIGGETNFIEDFSKLYDNEEPEFKGAAPVLVGPQTFHLISAQIEALQKEARRREANNATGTTKTF